MRGVTKSAGWWQTGRHDRFLSRGPGNRALSGDQSGGELVHVGLAEHEAPAPVRRAIAVAEIESLEGALFDDAALSEQVQRRPTGFERIWWLCGGWCCRCVRS